MQKRYVVRLTDQERSELRSVIKKLKGSGQKVRRAQILLKADADGPYERFQCALAKHERHSSRAATRQAARIGRGKIDVRPPMRSTADSMRSFRPSRTPLRDPVRRLAPFAWLTRPMSGTPGAVLPSSIGFALTSSN